MNTPEPQSSRPQPTGLQVELAGKRKRHLATFWFILSLAALGVAVLGGDVLVARSPLPLLSPLASPNVTLDSQSSRQQTQAQITWSENPLEVMLSPGETASRTLTLTSTRKVGGLRLCVSSTLTPFVKIPALKKHATDDDDEDDVDKDEDDGQDKKGCAKDRFKVDVKKPQSVEFTFTIPASTALGTYEGTIEVRRGRQTLPQTLNVFVDVWQLFASNQLGFNMRYPPLWITSIGSDRVIFSNTSTPSPISEISLQTEAFLQVRLLREVNPTMLATDLWFDQYFARGLPVEPLSKSVVVVGGKTSVRLEISEIGRRLHFYVPNGQDIVEITYGLFAPAFIETYESIVQSFQIN